MNCTITALRNVFTSPLTRSSTLPPAFLLPSFQQISAFSSTPAPNARSRPGKPKSRNARVDNNPMRGVSALHRTGHKKLKGLSVLGLQNMSPEERRKVDRRARMMELLPRPVLNPAARSVVEVDEDHGLWEFFPADRKCMATPDELNAHGRSWTIPELRNKDWDDLWRLWWVCLKELNRLKTWQIERQRVKGVYGDYEGDKRNKTVRATMKAIKATLTERYYAWENARFAAMEDQEINMYANLKKGEEAYSPKVDESETQAMEGTPNASTTLPPPESLSSGHEARA